MRALVCALAAALALPAGAEPLRGPRLGAATDFGQTWAPELLAAAEALPLAVLRDEIWWHNVETADGRFVFDTRRTDYPDLLPAQQARLMFLVNNPHPAYDGGTTPYTAEGAAAFARYVTQVLERFPQIDIVEIGNEMNSATFAWGPGWEGRIEDRAAAYVRLLKATAAAVRAQRPAAEIIGGAAHSIPLAWLRAIFAAGGGAAIDALALHPYTVAPEHLARQIALLRAEVPGAAKMPIAITEFGQTRAATAPAYLLKSYCQQALAGVTWAIWYPLNPRGDGLAALLTRGGRPTATGQVFRFLAATFEGQPVVDIAPDPFTYGCRFGSDWMVLWGAPRDVTLAADVRVVDPETDTEAEPQTQFQTETAGARLSPDRPLVLHRPGGLRLAQEVRLAPHGLIADTWHQFGYPETGAAQDPFQRLIRIDGAEHPLVTQPGQERGGVPWTPYLASPLDDWARADAGWARPSGSLDRPVEILHRYTAPHRQRVIAQIEVSPWEGGAALSVTAAGETLARVPSVQAQALTLAPLVLDRGDTLDVAVGPNGTGGGTDLRITLREALE